MNLISTESCEVPYIEKDRYIIRYVYGIDRIRWIDNICKIVYIEIDKFLDI